MVQHRQLVRNHGKEAGIALLLVVVMVTTVWQNGGIVFAVFTRNASMALPHVTVLHHLICLVYRLH